MKAGFVGLGNIGKPMALRLPAAGLETTVFDVVAGPVQELVARWREGGGLAARGGRGERRGRRLRADRRAGAQR